LGPPNNRTVAILVAMVAIFFPPLPWYITVPLVIFVYLFVRYLKYLDARETTKRDQASN
jgi:hypothetical protein